MSNQLKHSPGPWFWDDKDALPWTDYDETIHAPFLMDANGSIVMSGNNIRIRNEADGQLMVAVPDLLDALKTCVAFIEDAHIIEAQWNLYPTLKAKSAIAKAEGRENDY